MDHNFQIYSAILSKINLHFSDFSVIAFKVRSYEGNPYIIENSNKKNYSAKKCLVRLRKLFHISQICEITTCTHVKEHACACGCVFACGMFVCIRACTCLRTIFIELQTVNQKCLNLQQHCSRAPIIKLHLYIYLFIHLL